MKFRLPRLPDADDLLNKVLNELTGSEFVLDIKDLVLEEVKKELKPMVSSFLEEMKQELVEAASEQMCSIIRESLLASLQAKGAGRK
jgi:DNA-binding protein Fis